MKKAFKIIINIMMWGIAIFCFWGFLMFETIGFKIASIVAAVLACPLINKWVAQKISTRHLNAIRAVFCMSAVIIVLAAILLSPVNIDETAALKASVDVLKNRYSDCQMIDVKDYDVSLGEETDGIQPVYLTIWFVATRDGENTELSDEIVLYFDTYTGKYFTERPKGEL